jgi:hypothetical protein
MQVAGLLSGGSTNVGEELLGTRGDALPCLFFICADAYSAKGVLAFEMPGETMTRNEVLTSSGC